ncbi:MAG: CoA-binding protein [Candidatus Lokiarchaeota archaeon]
MIRKFFYPKSIAVIGATADPKKFGNAVTTNILTNDHLESKIFLVTHGSKEVCGKSTYESILDIEENIDIAIILVPAKYVEQVVDQCIEKKVNGIVIVTAGFGEIDEKGKEKEEKIAEKCRKAGIRVMGPNCVGIQNVDIGLNASFIQLPPKGQISMISQSGSFGCACFYEMERQNLGCSKFANLGNKIDVSFDEIINYFNKDETTQILSIYMENVSNGRKFFRSLEKINPNKPIVILKGGKSKIGMEAASSHTGSIATDYKLLKTAILQAGVTICEDISDFIIALKTFSFLPLPQGERVGVLTNSGGSSVLFSDNAEKFGLKFAHFSDELKKRVSKFLIPLVKLVNPLDMIAGAGEKQYYEVTKAMLENDNIDIVVGCCVIPPFLEMKSDEHYRGMIRAWNDTGRKKPVIPLMLFSEEFKN